MGWIAAGLCADVPPGTVIPVCINGTDLAVWCSSSGVYRTWGDRCPHRGMRLSHGFVRGDTLACIYHGWQYDGAGSCVYIPAHLDIDPPRSICTTAHSCEQRDGIIWVSLTETDAPPPNSGGRRPVRSMPIDRSADAIADSLGLKPGPILALGDAADTALAMQPVSDNSCMVHVLADKNGDPKVVSRRIEEMRNQLEAEPA
ncbi:Rieske 2Fe-2S domain-containing protein [Hoeflea sp.]|uniref:Rieske 2Fe-2S domain-containing protein n=1 Tax=Hoeflea sp. TaxID=1940281 RepID=UPI003B01B07C